jgi:hypothetical protein
MIIYNKTWLQHLQIQHEAEQAFDAGLITSTEQQEIKQKYPHGFYSPGIWIRVGLFILTCIIVSAASGMISLMFIDAHSIDFSVYIFLIAALAYAGLELMAGQSNHYKSGVDDALVLISSGTFLTGLCWLAFESFKWGDINGFLLISTVMFVCCLFLTLRFADMLMAAAAGISLLVFVFFLLYKAGPTGQLLLPFVMIISAGSLYLWAERTSGRLKKWYYSQALIMLQVVALMCVYLSGNYFVVRTLNESLSGSENLPFGLFFWFWTIAIPLVYIAWGLRKKDVVLLRSGLLLVAAAAFTIRNYFHLLSLEAILCLTGAGLIAIAYGVIRYLKIPKHGFTYEETAEKHLMDHMRVESLVVAETFSGTSVPPTEAAKFGGGDFGGGGASGKF